MTLRSYRGPLKLRKTGWDNSVFGNNFNVGNQINCWRVIEEASILEADGAISLIIEKLTFKFRELLT